MSKTLGEISVGDHACVVADSDEQHWEIGAGYVLGGLCRDEKVVYFDAARSTEPMLRRLHEDNVDVEAYVRSGQLVLMSPEQTDQLWKLSVGELLGVVDQTVRGALSEGYRSVRITDEPAGMVHRPTGIGCAELDQAVDEAMRGIPISLLCQYERADWSVDELAQLCNVHPIEISTPAIYDDGLLRITRTAPFTIRVAGEIDFSNRHLMRGIVDKELDLALRTLRHDGEIGVHLESLRFADVTSIVQLVQAAEGFPQSHQLVLYGVQPVVRRVLDRCGAAFTTQLTLREASK
ncbi:MAG TPA: MEDS domain-containing protein [Pseudonocardia sp.]